MPQTKAFGLVEDRKPREPAPLNCEGTCKRITTHRFSAARNLLPHRAFKSEIHDFYACDVCGHERVWG